MTPQEFFWLLDGSKPAQSYAGGMTESEVAELYELNFGEDGLLVEG